MPRKALKLQVQIPCQREPARPPPVYDLRANALPLVRDEVLQAEINSNPVAVQIQWVVVWFADAPLVPATGTIFTVRATSATTLIAGSWGNCPLTMNEDLPRGRYAVVGLRGRSAGCIAVSMVFVGGRWRPGCSSGGTPRRACPSARHVGKELG